MKSLKNHYRQAKKQGFKGTLEDFLKDLDKKDKVWGRSRGRVNGYYIYYDRCIQCGTQRRRPAKDGLCSLCFEQTPERTEYKRLKNAQYYRRDQLQKQETEIRNP